MIEKKFKIFEIIFLYSVKTAEIMFYNNIERPAIKSQVFFRKKIKNILTKK